MPNEVMQKSVIIEAKLVKTMIHLPKVFLAICPPFARHGSSGLAECAAPPEDLGGLQNAELQNILNLYVETSNERCNPRV